MMPEMQPHFAIDLPLIAFRLRLKSIGGKAQTNPACNQIDSHAQSG